MEELTSLPMPLVAGLVVLALVQLGLEIYAVIDIVRRPNEQINGGNKILWILLVLFVNTIGAVIYLVAGRKPAPAVDVASSAPAAQRAANAADMLYGPAESVPAAPPATPVPAPDGSGTGDAS